MPLHFTGVAVSLVSIRLMCTGCNRYLLLRYLILSCAELIDVAMIADIKEIVFSVVIAPRPVDVIAFEHIQRFQDLGLYRVLAVVYDDLIYIAVAGAFSASAHVITI